MSDEPNLIIQAYEDGQIKTNLEPLRLLHVLRALADDVHTEIILRRLQAAVQDKPAIVTP